MFLSLRLAALTLLSTALFISTGLAVPLYKRFVLLHQLVFCWKLKPYFELVLDLSNFVIFVQSSAIVNTETSPLSALMIHSLQVQTLLLVSNQLWDHIYLPFLSHKLSSLFVVSRTQEVDVSTQLRLGVRLLQAQARMCVQIVFLFFCFSLQSSYIYVHSSRNGKDLSFCHTSQF